MKVKYVIGAAIVALEMTLPASGMQNVVASPYGVCAHVGSPGEFELREQEFEKMRAAGIGWVRTDFLWRDIEPQKGVYRFDRFDKLMKSARKYGIRVLPILCYDNPRVYPGYAWQHPKEWCAYVEAVVKRYRGDVEVVEVWNEPNIPLWKPKPDVVQYTAFLRKTYAAIKAVTPEIRVMMAGTAGLDRAFIGKMFANGATNCVDIVNVHPYSWPYAPEGALDTGLEGLRKDLESFGVAEMPIWTTEHGWPTHQAAFKDPYIFTCGLNLARKGGVPLRCAFAKISEDDLSAESYAKALEKMLPSGSSVAALAPEQLNITLRAERVDVVVYPFGERYPLETVDAVVEFVTRGGTLFCIGGIPLYYAMTGGRGDVTAPSKEGFRDQARLRIGWEACWTGSDIPRQIKTFPTDEATAAGYKCDPAGCSAGRFFTRWHLAPGDRMVPILRTTTEKGREVVAAAVYLLDSDMKGSVIVSSLGADGGVTDEAHQALYVARSLAIAMAEGVEKYFPYEFQSVEQDANYSEHHFGICHCDLKPKPAYAAYAAFTKMRPAGSVQKPGKWHDENRGVFFPRWDMPDGGRGGMIWTVGAKRTIRQTFSDAVEFFDLFGSPLKFVADEKGGYSISISDQPIYWRTRK